MTATLKEIAERVGKSVTTVSRALADYDDVSQATRKQVRQVALELGYEPNIIARQLQKQRQPERRIFHKRRAVAAAPAFRSR